jgi:uncharacterized protein YkwD
MAGAIAHRDAMIQTTPARRRSRLALILVAGLLAAIVGAPGSAAAAASMSVSEAELAMVDALNADRTSRGLVPVRIDSRLMAIARARSVDMATAHYFSHYRNDRFVAVDMLNAQGIAWTGVGEIIAKNGSPTLEASVPAANSQWLTSPGHYNIVVSPSYNYVGVGLALEGSSKIWTAIYIKGPDRTAPTATVNAPTVSTGATFVTKRVTLTWTGADVPLQVGTSGLHSFAVERRVAGGTWTAVLTGTTLRTVALDMARGRTHEFRVAARDKAGNWSTWSTTSVYLPSATGRVVIRR